MMLPKNPDRVDANDDNYHHLGGERVRFKPVESYDLEVAGAGDMLGWRLRNLRDYYERP